MGGKPGPLNSAAERPSQNPLRVVSASGLPEQQNGSRSGNWEPKLPSPQAKQQTWQSSGILEGLVICERRNQDKFN
jgi:hypothetical protein